MSDAREPLPSSLAELDAQLRRSERRVLAELQPSPRLLVIAVLVFLLVLDLLAAPYVGAQGLSAPGRAVLAGQCPAGLGQVSKIAWVFTFFVLVDVLVSAAALVARRWGVAFLAAAVSVVSSAFGVFAIWHSQTIAGAHAGARFGLVLAAFLVVVLAFNWVRLVTARVEDSAR